MSTENPYQSPQSNDPRPRKSGAPSIGFRCLRALSLGLGGFVVYAAAQTMEIGTNRIDLTDSRYWIGILVASALGGSELLLVPNWPWSNSTLRRIILSAVLMFPACFFAAYLMEAIDPPMRSRPGGPNYFLFAAIGVVAHAVLLLVLRFIALHFTRARSFNAGDSTEN
jgi:hypothetical protein